MTETVHQRTLPAWLHATAIGLVALVVRLVYVWQVADTSMIIPQDLDPAFYYEWARTIAAGDWIGAEAFVQSPLYAYFLAFLMLIVGDGVTSILVVQSLLGCVTALLTWELGRRFFGRRHGLIAGLLIALYGPFIFYEGMVMKAFLSPLLTLALLLALDLARERATLTGAAVDGVPTTGSRAVRQTLVAFGLAGAAFALLSLTRDNFILMALPLAGVALLIGGGWNRRGWQAAAAFTVGAVLLIAPVSLRNWSVSGEFVLLTTGGGEVFFIGNNAVANGLYVPPPFVRPDPQYEHADFVQRASDITGRPLTAMQSSWFWFGEGMKFIVQEPIKWFGLVWRKMVHFWNVYELPDNLNYAIMQWFSPLLDLLNLEFPPHGAPTISVPWLSGWIEVRLHLLSTFGTVAPLGLVGLYLTRSRWRRLLPLYVVLFGYVATVMLFFNFSRFRLPIVPVLALFAAPTMIGLGRMLRKQWRLAVAFAGRSGEMAERALDVRPTRSQIIAAALLVVTTAGINTVLPRGVVPAIEQSVIIGNAFYARGEPEAARQSYFTALVLLGEGPGGPVGAALLRRHFGAAVTPEALREELEIETIARGDQFKAIHLGAHHGMGIALLQEARQLIDRGQRQQAQPILERSIGEFREALKLAPAYLLSLRKIAEAYRLQGNNHTAVEWLEKGIELWPDALQIRLELSEMYFLNGDARRALFHLEAAIRQNPDIEPRDLAFVHFSRGLILLRSIGDRATALYNLEQALAINPAHPQSSAIQATILELRDAGVEPRRDPAFDSLLP